MEFNVGRVSNPADVRLMPSASNLPMMICRFGRAAIALRYNHLEEIPRQGNFSKSMHGKTYFCSPFLRKKTCETSKTQCRFFTLKFVSAKIQPGQN